MLPAHLAAARAPRIVSSRNSLTLCSRDGPSFPLPKLVGPITFQNALVTRLREPLHSCLRPFISPRTKHRLWAAHSLAQRFARFLQAKLASRKKVNDCDSLLMKAAEVIYVMQVLTHYIFIWQIEAQWRYLLFLNPSETSFARKCAQPCCASECTSVFNMVSALFLRCNLKRS